MPAMAGGIHCISECVPEVAASAGTTGKRCVPEAEGPLLVHCGPRASFPWVCAVM